MNATSLKVARLVWDGPPDDPMEWAHLCPHCGELPEWERDGKLSSRWRLNCCGINDYTHGFPKGKEVEAVSAWNEAAECEKEALAWAQKEREWEARREEEDAWVDTHLPAAA